MWGHQKHVFELRVREGVHAADQGVDGQHRVVEAKAYEQGSLQRRGKYKSMTFTRVGLGTSLNYRSIRRQNHNNSNTSMFPRRSDGVGRLVNSNNTVSSPSIPTAHDGALGHSANANGGIGDFTLYGSSVSGNGGGRNATGAGNSDFMHYPGGMKMAASGSTGQINTHRSSARGTLKKKKKRPQTAQPSSSRSRKPASSARLAQMLHSKANNNNSSPNHTGRRSARPQTAGSSRSQRVEYAGSETRPKASARPQTAGPRRETIADQAKQRVPSARPQTAGSGEDRWWAVVAPASPDHRARKRQLHCLRAASIARPTPRQQSSGLSPRTW